MNSDWDDLYIKIDCLDETKTIPLEHSFIWGHCEGVISQKALRTLNFVTRSTASATEMRSDGYDLNIKVVPLGDVKFPCWNPSHSKPSHFLFMSCQYLVSTHAPLFFGKACMPKNTMHGVHSKDDVNTPSAIYFSQGDNYVSAIASLGFLPHTRVVFLQVLAIETIP